VARFSFFGMDLAYFTLPEESTQNGVSTFPFIRKDYRKPKIPTRTEAAITRHSPDPCEGKKGDPETVRGMGRARECR